MTLFFLPQIRKYKNHKYLHIVLGKDYCIKDRLEALDRVQGSILRQADYADALTCTFNHEVQSSHFGENASIGIEGVYIKYVDPDTHEPVEKFRSYVSDDKRQDSRTTYANCVFLIEEMQSHKLVTRGGKKFLMELMDGCGKQCQCGNGLCLMTVTSQLFNISVHRMISANAHGKGPCDAQNGLDKNCLRQFFRHHQNQGLER